MKPDPDDPWPLLEADDGLREPCPDCRRVEICADCEARILRLAWRAQRVEPEQGALGLALE